VARFLLLLILIVPVLEIALIIAVGQQIGILATIGLLIGAGILGAILLRQQGLAALMRMRGDLSARRVPARAMADTMMIGLAAILMVIPGFISDILAIALLIPPVRSAIYAALSRNIVVVNPYGTQSGPQTIELPPEDFRPRPNLRPDNDA
jgi:UPF0716 protein FxsA